MTRDAWKGLLLSCALLLILTSVAWDRFGGTVAGYMAGLGAGLLLAGTALVGDHLAQQERRERAELHRGETRQ